MPSLSRLRKIAVISIGVVGGALAYYKLNTNEQERFDVHNAWTVNFSPSVKWDSNWDYRDPKFIVNPPNKCNCNLEADKYNEEIAKATSKAVRHIILIRHGHYFVNGATDKDKVLTELGRKQADLTGQRLASLDIKWNLLIRSTMTRAQETATIIAKHLPADLEVVNCSLIEEGAPIPPEPPVGRLMPEPKDFFQDGARIEAGFRRYFYRAPPEQTLASYTLLVCHDNVIRYFVCRVLQFPPEAWLRLSLNHCSITWLSIMPNGNVVLRGLNDTGFMEPKQVTSRNA